MVPTARARARWASCDCAMPKALASLALAPIGLNQLSGRPARSEAARLPKMPNATKLNNAWWRWFGSGPRNPPVIICLHGSEKVHRLGTIAGQRSRESALGDGAMAVIGPHFWCPQTKPAPAAFLESCRAIPASRHRRSMRRGCRARSLAWLRTRASV